MPTYEYICKDCNYEFEHFQPMKDDPLTDCPSCKKKALKRKIGTGAGIIFKGTGFYCTDYRSPTAAPKSESSESSKSESAPKPDKKQKQESA